MTATPIKKYLKTKFRLAGVCVVFVFLFLHVDAASVTLTKAKYMHTVNISSVITGDLFLFS